VSAIAARARGLLCDVLAHDMLAEIERARDARQLVATLAHAGIVLADPSAIDRVTQDRVARDHAIVARWTDALAPLALDDDRRSVRAIARGMAAGVPAARRLAGAVATPSLPAARLAELAAAAHVGELAAALARARHPFASVVAGVRAPLDLLELELALARRFAELARTRDHALRTYLAQALDAENAGAALALAARGAELDAHHAFVRGGALVAEATFLVAAAGPIDRAREVLADVLAGTPLAAALLAPSVSALEDAALAWQLATQARLRRLAPLGLAPAIYTLLRRRDEVRRLRRAAWRIALEAT